MPPDASFMNFALCEAKKGLGKTSPNPAVGAIIVRDNLIIAKGFHHAAGQPHAEVEAISNLLSSEDARKATLYVTLEPCSTKGKTPPCTEAIIKAGFSRVVYGATDPNPQHRGRARELLTSAGIQVTEGVLAEECTSLNSHWNHRMTTGRPWVIAKCGMSLDGRIASPPTQRWITSSESRHHAMQLRSQVEAILVGGETVRIDNPKLTVRGIAAHEKKKLPQPWRIVWTRSGNIPKEAKVLNDLHRTRTMILTGKSLQATLEHAAEQGISSLLIEGGGKTLGEAFEKNLVDEVSFYLAPSLIGGPTAAVGGNDPSQHIFTALDNISYKKIGPDLHISGMVKK